MIMKKGYIKMEIVKKDKNTISEKEEKEMVSL